MAREHKLVSQYIAELLADTTVDELGLRLEVDFSEVTTTLPIGNSPRRQQSRLRALNGALTDTQKELIGDRFSIEQAQAYTRNIENYLGTMRIPLGVAGPLRVNGLFASGDYIIPLATTEAALVASYHRGSLLLSAAGGCRTMLLSEGVSRAPGFIFKTMSESGRFIVWVLEQFQTFKALVRSTSAHARLDDVSYTLEGNHVYLNLQYSTGDAAGQNMVTIATQCICDYIMENCPTRPLRYFVEANMSGDKKASQQSFQTVRGRKVAAAVYLPVRTLSRCRAWYSDCRFYILRRLILSSLPARPWLRRRPRADGWYYYVVSFLSAPASVRRIQGFRGRRTLQTLPTGPTRSDKLC